MRVRRPQAEPRIERAGHWLYEAHRRRDRLAPMPAELAPRSLADAYAIQAEYVGLRAVDLGAVVGYKIALTTPAMRAFVGLSDPVAGDLLEKLVRRGSARIRAADYCRLLVEFEIAVELGEDLPAIGAPYTRERVAQAVAAVMPAFEIADDRECDFDVLRAHPWLLAADNAFSEGAVLGAAVKDWQSIDLGAVRGAVSINGKPIGEGQGADVMGHPFEALTWLANHLASRGLGLWRSDIVITGSLVPSQMPKAGDRVDFSLGALGGVRLQVE